jgi:hypothetical protein
MKRSTSAGAVRVRLSVRCRQSSSKSGVWLKRGLERPQCPLRRPGTDRKSALKSLSRIEIHIRARSVVIRLEIVIPAALFLYFAFSLQSPRRAYEMASERLLRSARIPLLQRLNRYRDPHDPQHCILGPAGWIVLDEEVIPEAA